MLPELDKFKKNAFLSYCGFELSACLLVARLELVAADSTLQQTRPTNHFTTRASMLEVAQMPPTPAHTPINHVKNGSLNWIYFNHHFKVKVSHRNIPTVKGIWNKSFQINVISMSKRKWLRYIWALQNDYLSWHCNRTDLFLYSCDAMCAIIRNNIQNI